MLLLAPLVALVLSVRQAPEYEATAGVLLHLDPGESLAPRTSGAPSEDPARVVRNQARRAASLPVAELVVRATWPAFTSPVQLLDHSTVSTNEGVDLLTIAVRHSERVSAAGVADAYARQFALYLQKAQTMLAAFPSCVAPTDQPGQSSARKKVRSDGFNAQFATKK